jgi:hypothetical protein
MDAPRPQMMPRWVVGMLIACAVAALMLRLMAARGGLWVDEAWSAVFAGDVAPLIGVFASIHHDNNHHLNTLWLQLVGPAASPVMMRALSIVTGTAAVMVAALIGLRRGQGAALVAALLFATSPILLLYGSEARGYAPFVLAMLGAIWLVDGWITQPTRPPPVGPLATVTGLGTLSHLMMVPVILLLGGWIWITLLRRDGFRQATITALQAILPALIVCASLVGVIFGSAYGVAGGMKVGGFLPFDWPGLSGALVELLSLTSGIGVFGAVCLSATGLLLILTIALCLISGSAVPGPRRWLYLLLVGALPIAVCVVQPGNAQFPRYYMIVAVGLLLMLSDVMGGALARPGFGRWLSAAMLLLMLGGSMLQWATLVDNRRGRVDQAVAVMAKGAPRGARVWIDNPRAQAVLQVAAAQRDYRLMIDPDGCAHAGFWFTERERGVAVIPHSRQCGARWDHVASADAVGPSGQSWTLYAKRGLPSPDAAVNSPPPAR